MDKYPEINKKKGKPGFAPFNSRRSRPDDDEISDDSHDESKHDDLPHWQKQKHVIVKATNTEGNRPRTKPKTSIQRQIQEKVNGAVRQNTGLKNYRFIFQINIWNTTDNMPLECIRDDVDCAITFKRADDCPAVKINDSQFSEIYFRPAVNELFNNRRQRGGGNCLATPPIPLPEPVQVQHLILGQNLIPVQVSRTEELRPIPIEVNNAAWDDDWDENMITPLSVSEGGTHTPISTTQTPISRTHSPCIDNDVQVKPQLVQILEDIPEVSVTPVDEIIQAHVQETHYERSEKKFNKEEVTLSEHTIHRCKIKAFNNGLYTIEGEGLSSTIDSIDLDNFLNSSFINLEHVKERQSYLSQEINRLNSLNSRLVSDLERAKKDLLNNEKNLRFCTEENRNRIGERIRDIERRLNRRGVSPGESQDLQTQLRTSNIMLQNSQESKRSTYERDMQPLREKVEWQQKKVDDFKPQNDSELEIMKKENEGLKAMCDKIKNWEQFKKSTPEAFKTATKESNFQLVVQSRRTWTKSGYFTSNIIRAIIPTEELMQLQDDSEIQKVMSERFPSLTSTVTQSPSNSPWTIPGKKIRDIIGSKPASPSIEPPTPKRRPQPRKVLRPKPSEEDEFVEEPSYSSDSDSEEEGRRRR